MLTLLPWAPRATTAPTDIYIEQQRLCFVTARRLADSRFCDTWPTPFAATGEFQSTSIALSRYIERRQREQRCHGTPLEWIRIGSTNRTTFALSTVAIIPISIGCRIWHRQV